MKTWFITGATRGLGLDIARVVLQAGHQVVATGRAPEKIAAALAGFGDRVLAVALDVTVPAQARAAVDKALARFGRIDVLMNNAGYGQLGPFEEISAATIERQFATNVFGAFHVTRAVLPGMRARRAGHIFNISSNAGISGFAGASIYCSSKFALEGWSESLAGELKPLGIRVTAVEPGHFRTDFLDRSSIGYGDVSIPDYAKLSAGQQGTLDAHNHLQAGDPAKLGAALLTLVEAEAPPVRFTAGTDSFEMCVAKTAALRVEWEAWRDLSASTDTVME